MKVVTMILACCIAATAFPMEDPVKATPGPTVNVKIVFGKKKLDCQKFGICEITFSFDFGSLFGNNLAAVEDRVGYGIASATESARLSVRFVKAYMTDETRNEFFRKGEFTVEEDYVLPEEVTRRLGLSTGYAVREGTYTYTENSEEIILIL